MTAASRIGYLLKMFPRFSETFVLNEVLELEAQGVPLHIFSLKKPDDGRFHADVSRVRAQVTYAPECAWSAGAWWWHTAAFREDPRAYQRQALRALSKRRRGAVKRFNQAVFLATHMRAHRVRHVHAHFASSATSVAWTISQLTGIPYSFTAHAKDIFRDSVSAPSLERKFSGSRFAVTVSDYNVDYLRGIDGAERLVRIYNGLDLTRFRRNGHVPADPPLVLAVGRLVEKKGFDELIRACAEMRDRGHRFRCRIVGHGEEEGRLARLIAETGVGGIVELLGPLPRETLLDLIPTASVFVAPCVVGSDGNRDGLPTVLVEAMALGVPVVATPVTGIPELVADGATGLLVPERDPIALAAAIGRLLTDPGLGRQLAQSARQLVEAKFDITRNVEVLRRLLTEVPA